MDGLYEQFRISLHSVWSRRWLALGVAWGICLLGWLVLAFIPNKYESRAHVFVQMQPILPSSINVTPDDRQSDLIRIRQSLVSTGNLEKIVRGTDLNLLVANDRDLAAQVAALRTNIQIVAQQDNLFEISATSAVRGFSNAQNARTAAGIVQGLLDTFVSGDAVGDRAETGKTLAFIDGELKRRQAQLQDAEQRRVAFETRYMGLLPGEGSIEQRVAAARAQLADLDQQIVAGQSSLAALRGQMAGTPPSVDANGIPNAAGPASSQIAALEAQIAQARAKGWTDQHPDIVSAKEQIARLRPQANAEKKNGGGAVAGAPNPLYLSLRSMMAEKEAQVAAAQSRKTQIETDLASLMARRNAEPGVAAEQARLNDNYDVLKRQYEKLLEDREQIRLRGDVDSKADSIRFKIIDPASLPTAPLTPNRPLLLSLILIVAIAGGIGAAFVKGQLQPTFPTQGRLEAATGLPVLGSVSRVLTAAQKTEARRKLLWFGGTAGALAGSYALLMLVEFWQRSLIA